MNVLKLFFFLIVILIASCKKYDEVVTFEASSYLKLLASYEVQVIHPEYLISVEPLATPPATWQNLVRLKVLSENGSKDQIYCLNYQMPFEKMKIEGELRLEETLGACQPGNEKNIQSSLGALKNLRFFLSSEKQLLKADQKELSPYVLYLKFERRGEEEWLEFPLLNLEKTRLILGEGKPKGHEVTKERYASSLIDRYIPGTMILPYGKNPRLLAPSEGIGEMKDSYGEGKPIRCHDIKVDCTEVTSFTCDECRYGWYEVAGSKCKGGYVKFCGVRRCGGKNEVACLRGTHFNQLSNVCFDGSNAAFCQEGFHTYCDENGILICK